MTCLPRTPLPALMLVFALGGCAVFDKAMGNDPEKPTNVQRADQCLVAVDTAVRALIVLSDQGYVDDATRLKAVSAAKAARAAALGLRLASLSGDNTTYDDNLATFNRSMDDLLRAKFGAENARALGASPTLAATAAIPAPAPSPLPAAPTIARESAAETTDADPEPGFAPPTR